MGLGNIFASKPKTETVNKTESTTVAPLAAQQPYWNKLWGGAGQAYDQTRGMTYKGPWVAGPTQPQQQGVEAMLGLAGRTGGGEVPFRSMAMDTLTGKYMDPASNPWLASAVESANSGTMDALKTRILPGINDKAISEGAYGGARQDLQQERAVNDAFGTMDANAKDIYYKNYLTERQNQLNSAQLFTQADQLGMSPITMMMSAGGQQQQWDQAQIDAALKQFQEDYAGAWRGNSELAQILQAGGFKSGTSNSQATKETEEATNPLASLMQGLTGGAGTGMQLAQTLGGVAAGAGASAFMPWMLPLALLGGGTSLLGSKL